MAQGDKLYFNPMVYSLKKCDYWLTTSKTYYKEIYENPQISGMMYKFIEKTRDKSNYVTYACDLNNFPREQTRNIYQEFNLENFRELRGKNKTAILKEFSIDRIKTNFIDPTLFKGEGVKIVGNLDSFYDAPLFLVHANTEIFSNGLDIAFNSILKLFELHKNIQVIISIKDGLNVGFIKNWIEFLSNNKYLNGKWVFIDGEINLPKFFASTDAVLYPRRLNKTSIEHFVAMHYGCVPIVSRSGILNDTIPDIFDDISYGCGFKTKEALLMSEDANNVFQATVMKALNLYQNNPNSWNLLIKNCMNHDSQWNFKIIEKYNRIYQELI